LQIFIAMKNVLMTTGVFFRRMFRKCPAIIALLLFLHNVAPGQTFEFPVSVFTDTISIKRVLTTTSSPCDTFYVRFDDFGNLTGPKTGPNYLLKSVTSLVKLAVDVQSLQVGKYDKFT